MRPSFHVLLVLLVVSALTAVQCGRQEASPSQSSPRETEAPDLQIPEAILVDKAPADEITEPEHEETDASATEEDTQALRIGVFDQKPIHIDDQPVPGDTFEDQLQELERILTERQARAERDGIQLYAVVAPDASVLWRKVVEVFNRCVRAGIDQIGFAPVEPTGASDTE